jgi:hypothetical protein
MASNETDRQPVTDNLDLLNEFASGEDEFDVDLMACGCRLAAEPNMKLSIYDLVRLHNLDNDQLVSLLGALIDETGIDTKKLFTLADKAGRGKLKEPDAYAVLSGKKIK